MTRALTLAVALALALAIAAPAATVTSNIDPSNSFAWGENVGWINFVGQGTGDVATPPPVISAAGLTGYAWAENIGWINFGTGTNADPNDFGVILNPADGVLSGYAWGENVGWINFGTGFAAAGVSAADTPTVNMSTGAFTGYAWGENIGWINLDGSPTSQVVALSPTARQIADGLAKITPIPLFSDRDHPPNGVDAADVVTRVNDGFP